MIKNFLSKTKSFFVDRCYAPPKNDRLAKKVEIPGVKLFFKGFVWAIAIAFPAVCYLVTEYVHFESIGEGRLTAFLLARGDVAAGMITMTYFIWLALLLLFRKATIANVTLAAVYLTATVVNHFKYTLTGDFFYPWDMVQSGNVGELTSFLSNGFPIRFLLAAVLIILVAILPSIANTSLPLRYYVRLPMAALLIFAMFFTVSTPGRISQYLARHSMSRDQAAMQDSNYKDNGFVGGFVINLLSMKVEQPDGYSKETVNNILSDYTPSKSSESFNKPDVIVILSESFWDPKDLPGSSFTDAEGNEIDPIANFERISSLPGTVSGMMANTALGGGTVRPEFEVLTGLSTDYLPGGSIPFRYLNTLTDSYPNIYKSMGYSTYAVHPYHPAFYSRNEGYPYIGIDDLSFEQDFYDYSNNSDWQWQFRGKHIADISFVEYIEHILEDGEGENKFVMGISMEAHQPYETKYDPEVLSVFSENPSLSEDAALSFRNFTMAMYDADQALGALVDYIDNRDKDTILIYFGDHLPTLGSNYAAYTQSGMISSPERDTPEDRYVTQRTPFLIYANFEMGESELAKPGEENEIASYNLLNVAAELIGAPRTEFHKFLTEFGKRYPSYNGRMKMELNEELEELTYKHQVITYDRVAGKNYSKGR